MTRIKLRNFLDMQSADKGLLSPDDVRTVVIDARVDTGAISLAIPEEVAEALGVPVIGRDTVRVADGRPLQVSIVGGIHVELLDRQTTGDAIVLPRGARPLLGAVQLEMLDLVVVPSTGEVVTNPEHPDGPILPLYLAS